MGIVVCWLHNLVAVLVSIQALWFPWVLMCKSDHGPCQHTNHCLRNACVRNVGQIAFAIHKNVSLKQTRTGAQDARHQGTFDTNRETVTLPTVIAIVITVSGGVMDS